MEDLEQSSLISHFADFGNRGGAGFSDVAQKPATNNCAVSQGLNGEQVSSSGWPPCYQSVGTCGLTEIPVAALL